MKGDDTVSTKTVQSQRLVPLLHIGLTPDHIERQRWIKEMIYMCQLNTKTFVIC